MGELASSESIIYQHGLGYNPKFECWPNAVVNTVRILMHEPNPSQTPQIFQFRFFYKRLHAYLVWQDCVLNGGVTALSGNFKDLPLPKLIAHGENITKGLISTAFQVFIEENEPDPLGFRLSLKESFPSSQFNMVLNCLVVCMEN